MILIFLRFVIAALIIYLLYRGIKYLFDPKRKLELAHEKEDYYFHDDAKNVRKNFFLTYKGVMFSNVPNLALAIGYTNASWTLKCDLTCEYICRLLNHMEAQGYDQCCPRQRDPDIELEPLLDFTSGYIQRSIDVFPKQGPKAPWKSYQNYMLDVWTVAYGSIEDGVLTFTKRPAAPHQASTENDRVLPEQATS